MLRQKLTLDPLKRLQVATTAAAAGAAGSALAGTGPQKVQVAVTSLGAVAGMAAVPVTQAQARTQVRILKQAAGKQMVAARTMTESEMAAILKQKPQLSQMQSAQLMPQFLAQVQSAAARAGQASPSTSGATQTVTIPVTAISMAGVTLPHMRAGTPAKVSTASQQQIRQLALQKQLITPQRKLTGQPQLAQVGGKRVPTQLSAVQIVQGQKQLPTTVTVQQIQQVMGREVIKVPPPAAGGARASPSHLQARVLPSSHAPIKQTIQVVSAAGGAFPAAGLARQQPRPAAVQVVQPAPSLAQPTQQQQQQQPTQQQQQQLQQTAAVALPQLKAVVSAPGSPSASRASPYSMRLRTVSGTAPEPPGPAATPPDT
ncbi:chromatin modification-related protein EAF1-like [Pollicipes pollicipes]|uniref:chromatin modification-related protein EAF1-like n=1 Tax=Pollicipes pollicipes TaxID=41117 RepID=UPI00188519DF|nr:chromatin modification-related protein EAF1-like [Pollicipes pollicipes]